MPRMIDEIRAYTPCGFNIGLGGVEVLSIDKERWISALLEYHDANESRAQHGFGCVCAGCERIAVARRVLGDD